MKLGLIKNTVLKILNHKSNDIANELPSGSFSVASSRSLSSLPAFTHDRYPHLQRGRYAQLDNDDVTYFRQLLPGVGHVITDKDDLEIYNVDWLKTVRGTT